MFKEFFGGNRSRNRYVTVRQRDKHDEEETSQLQVEHDVQPTIEEVNKQTPREEIEKQGDHLWTKCKSCHEIIFNKKLAENQMICPVCDYHFRISVNDRIKFLLDEDSFVELYSEVISANPLDFEGYSEKMEKTRKKTGLDEAIVTGHGRIHNLPIAIGIMDFSFAGGSMGSAVGEKLTSLIEFALSKRLPLVIFSTAGGARMQEGMLSLMQMAKTSAALAKYNEAALPYISVMTDPTTGGVTASYAMLGDINIAEPGALIAFAGPRVIKQTISQDLPAGFQRAEFLLEHGMIDRVVHRHNLRDELYRILNIHRGVGEVS